MAVSHLLAPQKRRTKKNGPPNGHNPHFFIDGKMVCVACSSKTNRCFCWQACDLTTLVPAKSCTCQQKLQRRKSFCWQAHDLATLKVAKSHACQQKTMIFYWTHPPEMRALGVARVVDEIRPGVFFFCWQLHATRCFVDSSCLESTCLLLTFAYKSIDLLQPVAFNSMVWL